MINIEKQIIYWRNGAEEDFPDVIQVDEIIARGLRMFQWLHDQF